MSRSADSHLETERLVFRRFQSEDQVPFARLNADPAVMQYFRSR